MSPKTPAPINIEYWVRDHINGHTGFVNVQYRKNKIIEVGLRPARAGMYIIGAIVLLSLEIFIMLWIEGSGMI